MAAVRYDPGHERGGDAVVVRDTSQQPDTHAIVPPPSRFVDGAGSCIATWLKGVPRDRITDVEEGAGPVEIIGSHQVLDQPFVVVLTQDGKRVGALRMRLYRGKNSSGDVYKIEDAIDAGCTTVQDLHNAAQGGDPRRLHNWDVLAATFGADAYELRIGGEGNINVAHFKRIHPGNLP